MTDHESMHQLADDIENRDDQSISDRSGIVYGLQYLRSFGYLSGKPFEQLTLADIHDGLRSFQQYCGLSQDGRMDMTTVRAMTIPRCGVRDVHPLRQASRQFLADKKPNQWNKRKLTWAVKQFVPGISTADQDDLFKLAWSGWSDICDLSFERISDTTSADVVIGTGQDKRDDFDGPGGTLGWAYMPSGDDSQLDVKFDLAETWVKAAGDSGILLFNVAAHEFGHILGLEHSKVGTALMAPFYNPALSKPQADDDLIKIQALYGPAAIAPVEPKPSLPRSRTLRFKVSGEIVLTLEEDE